MNERRLFFFEAVPVQNQDAVPATIHNCNMQLQHQPPMYTNAQMPAATTPPPASSPSPQISACGGRIGMAGPAWTHGKMERPAGTKDIGSWVARIYTDEQQTRLNVDEKGTRLTPSKEIAPDKPRLFRCGVGLVGTPRRRSSPPSPPPPPPQTLPQSKPKIPTTASSIRRERGETRPANRTFPAHWGQPPRMQTRDLRQWPGGYGRGSGTVATWIQAKMDQDTRTHTHAHAHAHALKPKMKKNAWPELVGMDSNAAKAIVQAEGGVRQVHCIPEGSMVTCDVSADRVRIFTTADGIVASTPRIA